MGELTLAQRALGPVLNFFVEQFFPKGIFYGKDYMKIFSDSGWEKMGPTGSAAFFVILTVRDSNATKREFAFNGVTSCGEPVGDWRMIVEKVDSTKEASK